MAQDRSQEQDFKNQAKRLKEFLASAGVSLKHTHALEAVAFMHGAKDWHTLVAASKPPGATGAQHASPDGDPGAALVVVTNYPGHSTVSSCPTRELALLEFLAECRRVTDVLGSEYELRFIGQDIDGGLPTILGEN
ncbi:MAG: hypothetical protein K0Q43_1 [Ramlibacter sp.]|jgi:hypothetical protein|nr:hypothetical protein [Ramlibacter sp.]